MSALIADCLRQLLAESGLQQRIGTGVRIAATFAVAMALLLCLIAVGVAALAAALFLALHGPLSPAAAAGITAAVFLVAAGTATGLMWLRSERRSYPHQHPAGVEPVEAAAEMQALLDASVGKTTAAIRHQPIASVLTAIAIGIAVERLTDRGPG